MNITSLVRNDFLAFSRKALRELDGTEISSDRYVEFLATELMKVADGEIKNLLINLPPRHLKTQLASICLTAWVLAHEPATKVLVVTYAEALAKDIARGIRSILRAPWYQKAFSTRLKKGHDEATHFGTTAGGQVKASSINGSVTGFGANFIVVDDVHNLADAGNVDLLKKNIELFNTAVLSRFNTPKNGRVIVIAHRVHDDDLSAKLLASPRWTSIVLPMIATRDQSYETAYGVWRRRKGTLLREDSIEMEEVERLRLEQVNPSFDLLYQQDADGQSLPPVKAEHFLSFDAEATQNLRCIISLDTATGKSDKSSFSVLQVWGFDSGGNFYLLDQIRERFELWELSRLTRKLARHYRPNCILIEEAAAGAALFSELTRRQQKRVQTVVPRGSKKSRFRPHIDKIVKGRVFLPQDCEFRSNFIDEFIRFPHGKHSDQVDAFSQALSWIEEFGLSSEMTGRRELANEIAVAGNSQFPRANTLGANRYIGAPTDRGIIAASAPSQSLRWRY